MKKIEFIVEKTTIEREIGESTAYAGAKSPARDEGDTFDRVATVDDDSGVLARYIAEACCAAAERLKQFVTGIDFLGDRIRLTLEVSGSYDDSMMSAAENAFGSYLSAYALSRWMRLALPEKAGEWEAEAMRLMSELERNLYHRRRPLRRGPLKTGRESLVGPVGLV